MANTLPTTMEYFDNLLGEQLSGGGGGGSSDFSTAEVTLNLTVNGKTLVGTSLETSRILFPSENAEYTLTNNFSTDNKSLVLLYQGKATVEGLAAIDSDENFHETIAGTPVTTGGVRWDAEGFFEITGDGSITATLE